MDRNQVIGLTLIFAILFAYFQFFAPDAEPPEKQVSQTAPQPDTTVQKAVQEEQKKQPSPQIDSTDFPTFQQPSQAVYIENKELKVGIDPHGARFESVLLKNYEDDAYEPLYLIEKAYNSEQFILPTTKGPLDLKTLAYTVEKQTEKALVLSSRTGDGKSILIRYTLKEKPSFMLDMQITTRGMENLITPNTPVAYHWRNQLQQIESDIEYSREKATINYYTQEDGFDYLSVSSSSTETETISEPLEWFSFKQKFFNAGFIARGRFTKAEFTTIPAPDTSQFLKTAISKVYFSSDSLVNNKARFAYYFGPNKLDIVKHVAEGYDKNVELGWAIFAPINRYFVLPVFHFLEDYISNYGIIVIILAILVKLLISPFTYSSYMGMAKMRVIKPELDELREKHGEDMQKMQQEQMKLYQKFGINPLAGCIPLLLQSPILIAMFNFFPNIIELRHKSFLWAHDLSVYDSIMDLPFSIPGYGDHVSLFTLLMTVSTVGLTYFNQQNSSATASGGMQNQMKYMMYIMPLVFMFVLNSYPSGLGLYYFVSNLMTIGQQVGIRQLVDEKKIRAQLEEKRERRKNKPKSKWRKRLDNAMKAAEEAQSEQQNHKKNRKGGKGGRKRK